MDADTIWRCAVDVPDEWYEGDREGLERLVEKLSERRRIIRDLITDFRSSPRNPFPNWTESPVVAVRPARRRGELADIR
jgi:hypothetical protein